MLRAVYGFLFGLLSLITGLITLQVYFDTTWGFLSKDGRVAVAIMAALLTWFIGESAFLRARTARRAKFADIVPTISAGFADIHFYERSPGDTTAAILAGERLCNALAHAMTLVSGTRCCASIKLLFQDDHPDGSRQLLTQTFCRSDYYRRSGQPNAVKHWVRDNSDFMAIFSRFGDAGGSNFFSNRLPFQFDYRNTSFEVCGHPDGNILTRYWRWPLPYKSTIIVPICPSHATKKSELIGFLCVDSTHIGAFQANTDTELMMGVADGIYNFFAQLSESEDVKEGRKKAP